MCLLVISIDLVSQLFRGQTVWGMFGIHSYLDNGGKGPSSSFLSSSTKGPEQGPDNCCILTYQPKTLKSRGGPRY